MLFPPPVNINRVEVIKGGGTQQAKDAVQQQHFLRTRQLDARRRQDGPSGLNIASDESIGAVTTNSSTTNLRSKSRRVSEHTMTVRRLQRFYAGKESGGEQGHGQKPREPESGNVGRAVPIATSPASGALVGTAAQSIATPAAEMGRSGPTASSAGAAGKIVSAIAAVGGGSGGSGGDAWTATEGSAGGPSNGQGKVHASGQSAAANQPRTSSPSKGRRNKVSMPPENVPRLLLRAMVGYDWVDEFNGQEVRVRGAFTERDVGVLEVCIYCPWATGDSCADPSGAVV